MTPGKDMTFSIQPLFSPKPRWGGHGCVGPASDENGAGNCENDPTRRVSSVVARLVTKGANVVAPKLTDCPHPPPRFAGFAANEAPTSAFASTIRSVECLSGFGGIGDQGLQNLRNRHVLSFCVRSIEVRKRHFANHNSNQNTVLFPGQHQNRVESTNLRYCSNPPKSTNQSVIIHNEEALWI